MTETETKSEIPTTGLDRLDSTIAKLSNFLSEPAAENKIETPAAPAPAPVPTPAPVQEQYYEPQYYAPPPIPSTGISSSFDKYITGMESQLRSMEKTKADSSFHIPMGVYAMLLAGVGAYAYKVKMENSDKFYVG